MAKAQPQSIFGTGKRKESVARIKLTVSKGNVIVNEKPINAYFPTEFSKTQYFKAFNTLGLDPANYTISVKLVGGGKRSQLEAVMYGMAKTLLALNPEYRPQLKAAGLMHRDPRVKERRKYGLAHKARAKKQSPKR